MEESNGHEVAGDPRPIRVIISAVDTDPDYKKLQGQIHQLQGDIATLTGRFERLSRALLNTMKTTANLYRRERGKDGSMLSPDFINLISEEDLFDAEQNWSVEARYEKEKFFADEGE